MSDHSENPVVDGTPPGPAPYSNPAPNLGTVNSEGNDLSGSDLPPVGTGLPANPALPSEGNDSSS